MISDIWVSDVNVTSNTTGTFFAPLNMTPGIYPLKITNNLLKYPPVMSDFRTIEYFKVPELFSVMPSEIPTMDVS